MQYEINWDDLPATHVKATLHNDQLIVLFEGWNSEYRQKFSGRINLDLKLGKQQATGEVLYEQFAEKEPVRFILNGEFLDESWEWFEGVWEESGESSHFDLISDGVLEQPTTINQDRSDTVLTHLETVADTFESEQYIDELTQQSSRLQKDRFNRKRAARSDARVRSIQRKIELQYGLPVGSVKLCNPDRTIIRPDAKVGTLRERWE